jgi:acyl carrier protein
MMAESEAIAGRVRDLLAQVTGVSPSEVGPGFSQETAPSWTSLVHLMLVSQIEQEFAVTLTNDEIRELTSFDRIVERLSRRAGAA